MRKGLIALGIIVTLKAVDKLCTTVYRLGLEDGHERGHRCIARALAASGEVEVEVEHTLTLSGDIGHIAIVPMHGEN